jgi:hypothetical protein
MDLQDVLVNSTAFDLCGAGDGTGKAEFFDPTGNRTASGQHGEESTS